VVGGGGHHAAGESMKGFKNQLSGGGRCENTDIGTPARIQGEWYVSTEEGRGRVNRSGRKLVTGEPTAMQAKMRWMRILKLQ